MGVVTMAVLVVVVVAATAVVVVGEALSGEDFTEKPLTGETRTEKTLTGEDLTAEDLSIPTPAIKTEAPPPLLFASKDCPLYEQGELRGIKRHGDKWLNDGSDCEICTCFNGEKRCYYHYCNGLTEGYMTPPSLLDPLSPADQPYLDPPRGHLPLDDEDLVINGIDDDHEGSGIGMQLPYPDDEYYMHYSSNKASSSKHKLVPPHQVIGYEGKVMKKGSDDDKNPADNETHDQFVDDFCGVPCRKACPHGYKMDPSTGCRKCKCIKCQSMQYCLLKCAHGLHIDDKGCQTCECRDLKVEDDIILDEDIRFLPDTPYIQEEILTSTGEDHPDGDEATRDPPCNNTETVSPGPFNEFGQGYSRTTSRVPHHLIPTRPHATDTVVDQAAQDHQDHSSKHHHHHDEEQEFIFTHNTPLENDGMIKSAVPGSSPDVSQLCVIILPVLVVMALVCFLIARWWRRSHRDKYDINSYRHEEKEKLQAVKTADDNISVRHV